MRIIFGKYFFTIAVLAFLALSFVPATDAQTGDLRVFNLRAGFYSGPVQYIGPLNPTYFGDPITYQFDDSEDEPEEFGTIGLTGGDVTFGGWTQVRLTPNFYLRGKVEYGSLQYAENKLNLRMWTPYRSFGAAVKWLLAPEAALQPYFIAGIDRLGFDSPMPVDYPDFSEFSPNQFGQSQDALAFPVSGGFNIRLGDRTSFFTEATFTYTNTDRLDNFTPPSDVSNYSLDNNAMFSLRFGLSVELAHRSSLSIRRDEIPQPEPIAFDPPELQLEETEFITSNLVPEDSLIASRQREAPVQPDRPHIVEGVEEEIVEPDPFDPQIEEFDAELELQFINQWVARMETDRPIIPREPEEFVEIFAEADPIEFDIPEFDYEAENAFIEDWRQQHSEPDVEFADLFEQPIPFESGFLDERGLLTHTAQEGYYVQVYASVVESYAEDARQTTIEELSDLLETPDRQVFIYRQNDMLKVRVGKFEGYSRTLLVHDIIEGTFIDAFILYYEPEDP